MFVDNCPAHPHVSYYDVKLVFLPPNTTSKLQPCNAGIIKATKANYTKKLVRHILFKMDEATSASDLARTVDVLDAIMWLKRAWDSVPDSTIVKCFRNCGFTVPAPPQDQSDDPELPADYNNILGDVPWDAFVEADINTATFNVADDTWEQELQPEDSPRRHRSSRHPVMMRLQRSHQNNRELHQLQPVTICLHCFGLGCQARTLAWWTWSASVGVKWRACRWRRVVLPSRQPWIAFSLGPKWITTLTACTLCAIAHLI